jgi:hypothetical protein
MRSAAVVRVMPPTWCPGATRGRPALGIIAVVMALRKAEFANTFAVGVMVVLWLWSSVAFNGMVFSGPWPGGSGRRRAVRHPGDPARSDRRGEEPAAVRPDDGRGGVVAGLAIHNAVVGYPAIGALMGGGHPQSLHLGLAPCRTIAFTLGWLLWSCRPLPKALLAIPVLYALTMSGMAAAQGISEDVGLVVIAVGRCGPPGGAGPQRRAQAADGCAGQYLTTASRPYRKERHGHR